MLGISNFQYRRAFKKLRFYSRFYLIRMDERLFRRENYLFSNRQRVSGTQYEPSVGENKNKRQNYT